MCTNKEVNELLMKEFEKLLIDKTEKSSNKKLSEKILEELGKFDYPVGPLYKRVQKKEALKCLESNEMRAICLLVDSHAPELHLKIALADEKVNGARSKHCLKPPLSKQDVTQNCLSLASDERIKSICDKVSKMPKEWTLIQITSSFNQAACLETHLNRIHANNLHLTVFNCGDETIKPFTLPILGPLDNVDGSPIDLGKELTYIVEENRNFLLGSNSRFGSTFATLSNKEKYLKQRTELDNRLKHLVRDVAKMWLKEWRCFFVGKYVDEKLEAKLKEQLEQFLRNENLPVRNAHILIYLIKASQYLSLTEMRDAVRHCFPDHKNIRGKFVDFAIQLSFKHRLTHEKRNPIILIIDEDLDMFPWEMLDICKTHPMSRIPSLHVAYAIYKKHKHSIKNGYKIIDDYKKGSYILNPENNLVKMENRMSSFLEYWTPEWKAFAGTKPSQEQFEEVLSNSDIIFYGGHGSGAQLFQIERILKLNSNAVVLLFGCRSGCLSAVGPQCGKYGVFETYLNACCPCILGMLWEVTDLETDTFSTQLLSMWIPSEGKVHWSNLDKSTWRCGKTKVDFTKPELQQPATQSETPPFLHESDFLRTLALLKCANNSYYLSRSASIARGIPVKVLSSK